MLCQHVASTCCQVSKWVSEWVSERGAQISHYTPQLVRWGCAQPAHLIWVPEWRWRRCWRWRWRRWCCCCCGTFCDIRNDFNFGPRRAATATNYIVAILGEIHQQLHTHTHRHTKRHTQGQVGESTRQICAKCEMPAWKNQEQVAHTAQWNKKKTNKKAAKMTPTLTARKL